MHEPQVFAARHACNTAQVRLRLLGALARDPAGIDPARRQRAQALRRHDWVVYAKTPLAGPAAVLDYLARYTHRTAMATSG